VFFLIPLHVVKGVESTHLAVIIIYCKDVHQEASQKILRTQNNIAEQKEERNSMKLEKMDRLNVAVDGSDPCQWDEKEHENDK